MSTNQKILITITDNLSATSMPYNEFVLYRRIHYPDEKQVIILLFKEKPDNSVDIPDDIDVYYAGKSTKKIKKAINQVVEEAQSSGAEIVVHIHEAKSVLFFSWATKFRFRHKTIYTLHSTYKNYPLHNKVFCFIASLLVKNVICVSKTSYKYYPRILKNVLGGRVRAIQNGVDLERIDSVVARQGQNNNTQFTLVYVARLVPLKNHHVLFDALAECRNMQLKLVGTGPLEEALKKYANEKGLLNRIEFMGLMPREQVFEVIASSDAYVSASSYEGLPVGVLEAMACGCPCLVSDIEQHREIKEDVPSLLTCSNDSEHFVEALLWLAMKSTDELGTIGQHNREGVRNHYSLERMHSEYDKVYV